MPALKSQLSRPTTSAVVKNNLFRNNRNKQVKQTSKLSTQEFFHGDPRLKTHVDDGAHPTALAWHWLSPALQKRALCPSLMRRSSVFLRVYAPNQRSRILKHTSRRWFSAHVGRSRAPAWSGIRPCAWPGSAGMLPKRCFFGVLTKRTVALLRGCLSVGVLTWVGGGLFRWTRGLADRRGKKMEWTGWAGMPASGEASVCSDDVTFGCRRKGAG